MRPTTEEVEVKVKPPGQPAKWDVFTSIEMRIRVPWEVYSDYVAGYIWQQIIKRLPLRVGTEVRWNYKGSTQGHYCTVTEGDIE